MNRYIARAFTLVELLVVITIIVVLLSLLMPAMHEAVYQAELVSCGSRLAVISAGVTQYALDHGRKYPYNPAHDEGQTWHSNMLRSDQRAHPRQQEVVRSDIDMRPVIRDYIQINRTLNDPLAASVELEKDNAELVYANYSMWSGWRWIGASNGPGTRMGRIGDRFTWEGVAGGQKNVFAFNLLGGDLDLTLSGPQYRSSHPDHDDTMRNSVRQNVEDPTDVQDYSTTLSIWTTNNGRSRDLIDTNFAYQDLSVVRFNHVQIYDDRMVRLPGINNGNLVSTVIQIPTN